MSTKASGADDRTVDAQRYRRQWVAAEGEGVARREGREVLDRHDAAFQFETEFDLDAADIKPGLAFTGRSGGGRGRIRGGHGSLLGACQQ